VSVQPSTTQKHTSERLTILIYSKIVQKNLSFIEIQSSFLSLLLDYKKIALVNFFLAIASGTALRAIADNALKDT
jgi:hypothetical protein